MPLRWTRKKQIVIGILLAADASPALPAYLACAKTEPSYTFCVDDVRCGAAGCDGECRACPPRHLAYDPAHNAVTCITH